MESRRLTDDEGEKGRTSEGVRDQQTVNSNEAEEMQTTDDKNKSNYMEATSKATSQDEAEGMMGIENAYFDSDEDEEMLTMATELENKNQGIITPQNTVIGGIEKMAEESVQLAEDSVESMSSPIEMEDKDRPSQIMRPSQSQSLHSDSESATSLSDSDDGHLANNNNNRLHMEPQPSTSRQLPGREPILHKPMSKNPSTKAVEEDARVINNLAYARTLCSFMYNCKTLKKESRLPLQPIQDNADWNKLARLNMDCLVPPERQDAEAMNRFFGGGMQWNHMFDNIVNLNKIQSNLDGLYKHFTFQVEDELLTSVTIEVQKKGLMDVLIKETLNQHPILKIPSHLWVNVTRPHNDLFLIGAENFKLMAQISVSKLNQTKWDLKGAIVRVEDEFESIVLSSDKTEGFRRYDKEGRPTPVINNMETWKDILYDASSLFFITNDIKCSEVYENEMVSDLFLEEEIIGSGVDYNNNDLSTNDKEFKGYHKRLIRIEVKKYNELKKNIQLHTKSLQDFEEKVFQEIKTLIDTHFARSIVSRRMEQKDVREVYEFIKNQKADIAITVEGVKYVIAATYAKGEYPLGIRESRSNSIKWALMCRVCLRKAIDSDVTYCYEHVQNKEIRLFILQSQKVEDCKEVCLEVVEPTATFNAQDRYDTLMNKAKDKLKYGMEFFAIPHLMGPGNIMTCNGYKEAEELAFAMDVWNWLKFRYIKNHKGAYFRHNISTKGLTSLKDMDLKEVGLKLLSLAEKDGYMMNIESKLQKDDGFIEETSKKYGIWMVRDRAIPFHSSHRKSTYCLSGSGPKCYTYWGTCSGKSIVANYHFDLGRDKFIADIGKEIWAECCFTTFCAHTAKMMESTIQLVSILSSMFSVKRLSDQTVPIHLNSKIETFHRIVNNINCSTLMDLLSLNEFGVKFSFRQRMEV